VTLENSFDSRKPVIDLDHFADERVKAGFKTGKAILDACESGVDVRFKTGEPGTKSVQLQRARYRAHHDREHRQANSEI
jgi:hypothetical protein